MDAIEVLDRLHDLGVTVQINGPKVRLEPASKVPADLLAAVRQNKAGIIRELRRPPETEQELRQLITDLADPENFAEWMERIMVEHDPAEPSTQPGPEATTDS